MSRNSLSSALLLTGLPWPGMMIVSVGGRGEIGFGRRDHAVDAAAGRIVDERIDAVPERVADVNDVGLGERDRDVAVGMRRAVIFQSRCEAPLSLSVRSLAKTSVGMPPGR